MGKFPAAPLTTCSISKSSRSLRYNFHTVSITLEIHSHGASRFRFQPQALVSGKKSTRCVQTECTKTKISFSSREQRQPRESAEAWQLAPSSRGSCLGAHHLKVQIRSRLWRSRRTFYSMAFTLYYLPGNVGCRTG